jgi:hypothetical protein
MKTTFCLYCNTFNLFLSEISKERAAERLTLTHYFQRKREQKPRDWPEREMEIVPRIAPVMQKKGRVWARKKGANWPFYDQLGG